MAKGDLGDDIEGEVGEDPGDIERAEFIGGGEVGATDQVDEVQDAVVDVALNVRIVLSRVLDVISLEVRVCQESLRQEPCGYERPRAMLRL